MQVEFVIEGTDIERFQAWMDVQAMLLEDAIRTNDDVAPVLYGWDKGQFTTYYEFCIVTPTPEQVKAERLSWNRQIGLAEKRGEQPPSDEHLDAQAWLSAAQNEKNIALLWRGNQYWQNGETWLYRPEDSQGQYRQKHVSAWIRAEGYQRERLRVTFWRDDAQPGYDALMDSLRIDFGIETPAQPSTNSADQVTPAPASSGADDNQVTLVGQLTEAEQEWYRTLLTCKQPFGNGEMTWQQIADRHGVSVKTAKRRLKALQERRLPGLEDWPDRRN